MFTILSISYETERSLFVAKIFVYYASFTVEALPVRDGSKSMLQRFVFNPLVYIYYNKYFGYTRWSTGYFI